MDDSSIYSIYKLAMLDQIKAAKDDNNNNNITILLFLYIINIVNSE